MRIIEALEIVEEAIYTCKRTPVDTPKVREALDILHSYVTRSLPQIEAVRIALQPKGPGEDALDMQDCELVTYYPLIHYEVRAKLEAHIRTLTFWQNADADDMRKAEIERLTIELERLPTWLFIHW